MRVASGSVASLKVTAPQWQCPVLSVICRASNDLVGLNIGGNCSGHPCLKPLGSEYSCGLHYPHHQSAESRMLDSRLRLRWRRNAIKPIATRAKAPPDQSNASRENHPSKVASSPSPASAIDANNLRLQFLALCQYVFDVSSFQMIVAR